MIVHIAMGKERNTFKNSAMIFVYLGFKVLRFRYEKIEVDIFCELIRPRWTIRLWWIGYSA